MRLLILSCVLLLVSACGEDEQASKPEPTRIAIERSDDPRVVRLREALDMLMEQEAIDATNELSPEFVEVAGVEAYLLRARLYGMRGDLTKAHPLIEAARAEAPDDPRVYATAAEVYAAPGQFETATAEIREGIKRCGATPEMQRAQGILHLCTSEPGSAERGLKRLQSAVQDDPTLPFTKKPLGQAYLLVARQKLAQGNKQGSLADIKRSLEYDPTETDAWHFLAEAYSALFEYERAIGVLQQLVESEQPLEVELALTHKKAGTKLLVEKERERALEHFMSARELGLSEEELGFGAQALRDESAKLVKSGMLAYRADDLAAARSDFERALAYDPGSLAARNHLGVAQFKSEDFAGAVDSWRAVIFEAGELGVDLPDPVHINLAKALMHLDDSEGALIALKDYLLDAPFGEFVDQTRELVASLESE